MPTHHPNDETLLAYSSAAMPAHAAMVVAAHLQMCEPCRRTLYFLDAVGGSLLARASRTAAVAPADGLPLGAMRAMRRLIDADAAPLAEAPMVAAGEIRPNNGAEPNDVGPDFLPHPLWPAFGQRYSALVWEPVETGLEQVAARGHCAEALRLVRISSLADLGPHAHTQSELTLVLKGSYRDAFGQFRSGDLADLDESATHAPKADPGEDCIAVVANYVL